jgi:hypothetical protein
MIMTDPVATTRRVPFFLAVAVTTVGLIVLLAAMPFAVVRLHGPLLEFERESGSPAAGFGFTRDDALMGLFVVGVAVVVLLAGVLRRPMIMGWAALPAGLIVGWMLLVVSDIQFDTSFLASDIQTSVNEERSLALGGWLTLVGMLVALVGLAIPLLVWWRIRRLGTAVTEP